MTVRTKIALLLFVVVATFIGGLVAVKKHDSKGFREVASVRDEERQHSFDRFLLHWSEPLETLVRDFTVWDKMVEAIEQYKAEWVDANLHQHTLASYNAHAVWAYNAQAELVFSRDLLHSDAVPQVPLPRVEMARLLEKTHFCHFFAQTPLGIMEIRGASIHPSKDGQRSSPPRGYFFAGRLWADEDLNDMALFTSNQIGFVRPERISGTSRRASLPTVYFERPLPGWDGRPIAALGVRNQSAIVERLNRSSERLFWSLLAFALVVFLVLLVSLTRWVSRPLKMLGKGLRDQDLKAIRKLGKDRSEFGDFARMMGEFFEQRETLLREMRERRLTEEALHDSEERLRHSQKMEAVGRLAGGIAHDFNNLLTAIIGYAELIALGVRDKVVQEEAELIRKAGEQAAGLTRQLLAFSRKQILQPRVIDLNALVLDMKKLLQRVIGEQIELRVATDAINGRVFADPTQLEQVIVNLGVNARDAMPRGGVLTMRTRSVRAAGPALDGTDTGPERRYVALQVEDAGCGMSAETRERIFEPFFTTKAPGKGTGLGLATVYGIVKQSGGSISVESELGEGTTFTVQFPEANAPVHVSSEVSCEVRQGGCNETVLMVEDEQIVRDLVCTVLTEQGYDVICAADGPTALRLAREHPQPIDLLVSDVIMPQMNGPEVARALLEEQPLVKVLFVSGYSDNDISDHGVLAPDVRFLEKPFTPEILVRKVRAVLDEPSGAVPVPSVSVSA